MKNNFNPDLQTEIYSSGETERKFVVESEESIFRFYKGRLESKPECIDLENIASKVDLKAKSVLAFITNIGTLSPNSLSAINIALADINLDGGSKLTFYQLSNYLFDESNNAEFFSCLMFKSSSSYPFTSRIILSTVLNSDLYGTVNVDQLLAQPQEDLDKLFDTIVTLRNKVYEFARNKRNQQRLNLIPHNINIFNQRLTERNHDKCSKELLELSEKMDISELLAIFFNNYPEDTSFISKLKQRLGRLFDNLSLKDSLSIILMKEIGSGMHFSRRENIDREISTLELQIQSNENSRLLRNADQYGRLFERLPIKNHSNLYIEIAGNVGLCPHFAGESKARPIEH